MVQQEEDQQQQCGPERKKPWGALPPPDVMEVKMVMMATESLRMKAGVLLEQALGGQS